MLSCFSCEVALLFNGTPTLICFKTAILHLQTLDKWILVDLVKEERTNAALTENNVTLISFFFMSYNSNT